MSNLPSSGVLADYHWYCNTCQSMGGGHATKEEATKLLDDHLGSEKHRWRVGEVKP